MSAEKVVKTRVSVTLKGPYYLDALDRLVEDEASSQDGIV